MKNDYSYIDIKNALLQLDINKGDIIFCHSNLIPFGIPKKFNSVDDLCKIFFNSIIEKIGPKGTLIVPTFTYSFSKYRYNKLHSNKEAFDVANTKSLMGVFSEYVRKKQYSIRSQDPFYSVSAHGNNSKFFSETNFINSFNEKSLFAKLLNVDAKILNFNFPGTTLLHYFERKIKINYRFNKKFNGTIIDFNKKKINTNWYIYVAKKNEQKYQHNPFKFDNYIKNNNYCNQAVLGRGIITSINSIKIYNIVKDILKKDKLFLIN